MRLAIPITPILLLLAPGCLPGTRADPRDELAAQTALSVMAALSEEDYPRAYSYFDADTEISWSIEEVEANWKTTVNDLGKFDEVTQIIVHPTNIRAAKASTVLLQCRFQRGTAFIAMEVAEDGRVVQYSGP